MDRFVRQRLPLYNYSYNIQFTKISQLHTLEVKNMGYFEKHVRQLG